MSYGVDHNAFAVNLDGNAGRKGVPKKLCGKNPYLE